jgi:hypothetical protein
MRKIPQDERDCLSLLLMRKRTDPGSNERLFKFHEIFINFFFRKINGIL